MRKIHIKNVRRASKHAALVHTRTDISSGVTLNGFDDSQADGSAQTNAADNGVAVIGNGSAGSASLEHAM